MIRDRGTRILSSFHPSASAFQGSGGRPTQPSVCLPTVCWHGGVEAYHSMAAMHRHTKKRGVCPNVTVSLRYFYGTFTTSLPPFVILPSIKADDALERRSI